MNRWDADHDGEIYRDIQAQWNPALSLYALESYAIIVDNAIQNELLRNLVLSHADIARRLEETNRRLAESEMLLQEAQQIAHIGRWDIDHVRDTRNWSASYLEILRLDPSIKPSRELFESFIVPEDLPLVHQGYIRLMTQRIPWDSQVRLRLRNGELIWVHIRLQTEFDEAGETPSQLRHHAGYHADQARGGGAGAV